MFSWLQHLFTLRAVLAEKDALVLQLDALTLQLTDAHKRIGDLELENADMNRIHAVEKKELEAACDDKDKALEASKAYYQQQLTRIHKTRVKP